MEPFINEFGLPCIALVAPGGTRRTVIEMRGHNFRVYNQRRGKEIWINLTESDTYIPHNVVEAAHRLLRANVMK